MTGKPISVASFSGLGGRPQRSVGAGEDRNLGGGHRGSGLRLVAHHPDRIGRRSDEGQTARADDFGKVGIFRQKAVAGVDRVGAGEQGRRHHGGGVEVGTGRIGGADAHRLVGELDVQALAIGLGVDGHGLNAELAAGGDDPHRDLSTIGDQDLRKHRFPAVTPDGSGRAVRRTPRVGRFEAAP